MPVDFTFLEPEGLQLHILLCRLMSKYEIFKDMSEETKANLDEEMAALIQKYLPYHEEQ